MRLFFGVRSLLIPTCTVVLVACASPGETVNSGLSHLTWGDRVHAIPLLLKSVPELEASNPADPRVPRGYVALGDLAAQDKRADLAKQFYDKALANARAHHSANASTTRSTLVSVGNYLVGAGRPVDAVPLLFEAVEISERVTTIPRVLVAVDMDNLAFAMSTLKNYEEADTYSDKALRALSSLEQSPQVKGTTGVVHHNLAYRRAEQGRDTEAEKHYLQAMSLVAAGPERWRLRVVSTEYAKLLRRLGRTAEADSLQGQYK